MADPQYLGTPVLFLKGEGADGGTTFTDSSPSEHSVSANGDVQIDTAQFKYGSSSILFDGTDDYLTINDSEDWNFGAGDFTIEGWVRFAGISAEQYLYHQTNDAGTDAIALRLEATNKIRFFSVDDASSVGDYISTSALSISTNTWYHFAFVRSGATAYFFLDGASQALTETTAFGTLPDILNGPGIGVENLPAKASFLNGWLDDFRIVKSAIYTSNFNITTLFFDVPPQKYSVELRDTDGVLVSKLDTLIIGGVSWEYNRIGGCGNCSLIIKTKYDSTLARKFREDYRILIYIPNPNDTDASILAYQGYIDKVTPTVDANERTRIFCLGFVNQLKRIALQDYNRLSGRIDILVRNIIDEEVTPLVDIRNDPVDYDAVNYSVKDLDFNNSAYDIISTLADIAGNREWGVRADRSFFFKKRVKDTYYHYFIGKQILDFSPEIDYNPMITAIYFDGGDVSGNKFTSKAFLKGASNHKQAIMSNGSITAIEDASRWLRYKLKDLGSPQRVYSTTLFIDEPFENANLPLGSISIDDRVEESVVYDGTSLWDGTNYYSGERSQMTIEKINYTLTDTKLMARVSLNGIKSDIVDRINQLEFEVGQKRNT